ncbi:MAG: hypothetical protein LBG46_05490 [Elusimicrobiota bacterium]|nr:hypothetical protein [Elusimicrobiota bacterium]
MQYGRWPSNDDKNKLNIDLNTDWEITLKDYGRVDLIDSARTIWLEGALPYRTATKCNSKGSAKNCLLLKFQSCYQRSAGEWEYHCSAPPL